MQQRNHPACCTARATRKRVPPTRKRVPPADPNRMSGTSLPVWLRFCHPNFSGEPLVASHQLAPTSLCDENLCIFRASISGQEEAENPNLIAFMPPKIYDWGVIMSNVKRRISIIDWERHSMMLGIVVLVLLLPASDFSVEKAK